MQVTDPCDISAFHTQHSIINNNQQSTTFNIQHSTFNIQHSTFNIQCSPTQGNSFHPSFILSSFFLLLSSFLPYLFIIRDALRYFGWCPQFNALWHPHWSRAAYSPRTHQGPVDESDIPESATSFLGVLDMEHLTDRLVGGYSGGNKRKLSLAIAMIGNPPLVLLDGMLGEGERAEG